MLNHLLTFLIFFVIGIEIRHGLQEINHALAPIIGAIGGMIFPALIFKLLQPESHAWATVMPTDVVLALGAMALLGKKINSATRLFLMTLAIADDFFSLLIMAFFYRNDLDVSSAFYTLGAALIGVLIPSGDRLLRVLNPLTQFLVVPLYIVINLFIGLTLAIDDFQLPSAIMAARVIGKVVGVSIFVWCFLKFSRIPLPSGVKFYDVVGVGFFCGMGMTVSLVIAEIALTDSAEINAVKVGLFISAFVSALLGLAWFKRFPGSVFVLDEIRNIQ